MTFSQRLREVKGFTPDEIREKLQEHDLSQAAFARLCGMSVQSIHNVLTGKHGQSALTRIRIMQVLDELDREAAPHTPEGVEPVYVTCRQNEPRSSASGAGFANVVGRQTSTDEGSVAR